MKMVKLGDIASPSGKKAGFVEAPVYAVTKYDGFVRSDEYFKKQIYSRDTSGYKLVEPGEFAYATIHLDEGSIGIAPERALISPMYTVFSINTDLASPEYLIRFLKSDRALSAYQTLGSGSAHRRKSISFKSVSSLQVPLPPLDEQRRIAAILGAADASVSRLEDRKTQLTLLPKQIFDTLLPKVERYTQLQEICDIQGGLQVSSKRNVLPISVTYLRVANVHRGFINLREVKSIKCSEKELERVALQKDDLLFVEGHANPHEVGRVAKWGGGGGPMVHQNHLIRARLNSNSFDPTFLEQWFSTPPGADHFARNAKTTSGLNTISVSVVKSAKIPLVDLDVQRKFRAIKEQIDRLVKIQNLQIQKSQELKQSLQSRAFRGEL